MEIFILCIKIFIVRIIDVSLATCVTVLTVKNRRLIATILGFIDVLIWFLIVKEALNTELQSIWIAFSYAGGYACGTFVGTTLSNILIKGKISVQVILNHISKDTIDIIREEGYAVSELECKGKDNTRKTMLFIEVDKKNLNNLNKVIKEIDKNAFIVANETKFVSNGFFK